jgi:solute carrier family 1 (neuronal/epithelial high affinity glutamate transporter), member 1
MKGRNLLTALILIGLVLGVIVGELLFQAAARDAIDPGTIEMMRDVGNLVLIRPLMLLIVPLIFAGVIVGVTSLGDPSRLGLVGGSTVLYYMVTMLIAVTLGASMVTIFKPGVGLDPDVTATLIAQAEERLRERPEIAQPMEVAQEMGLGGVWMNILHQFVPTNIVAEMAAMRPPGIIVFAILFGLALAAVGEKAKPVVDLFNGAFTALLALVLWIIWLAPIGVFFLVTWSVGTMGLAELAGALGKYMLVVFAGLVIHGAIALPLVLYLLTRRNPYRYMWQMRKALLTAFGTSSSYATLPVTIQTAEMEGGCSKRSANFVLPLGSTINMDGTALYSGVAVIFLFQLFGLELQFGELIVVIVTATLAAVGAAGIPGAGLITMVIIISAVNTSLAGRDLPSLPVEAIGIIIGVDRILDMCRTVVNVWGDAVGAKVMTRLAPDTEEEMEQALG